MHLFLSSRAVLARAPKLVCLSDFSFNHDPRDGTKSSSSCLPLRLKTRNFVGPGELLSSVKAQGCTSSAHASCASLETPPFVCCTKNNMEFVQSSIRSPFSRPLVIERMGICTEQAVKIRNLVKAAGMLPGGGAGGSAAGHDFSQQNRACEELRAARDHARVVEQHAEILVLSLRCV